MSEKIRIGYVCNAGHFQLHDDPEGDNCQTKNIAPIYVEIQNAEDRGYIIEAIDYALASYNYKLEKWRRS